MAGWAPNFFSKFCDCLFLMFHLLCRRQQLTNDMPDNLDTMLQAFPIDPKHALSLTMQEECDLLEETELKTFESWNKYCELQRRYMTEDVYKHDVSCGNDEQHVLYPALSTHYDTVIAEGATGAASANFAGAFPSSVFPWNINGQVVMWNLAPQVRFNSHALHAINIPEFMKPRFVTEAIWIVDTVDDSIACVSRLFVRMHFAYKNAKVTKGIDFQAGSYINDGCVARVATCLQIEKALGRPVEHNDFPQGHAGLFAGCLGWHL